MGKLVRVMLAAVVALTLVACSNRQDVSSGQQDQVAGFIFVFDTRPATVALVDAMEAGTSPKRLTVDFGRKVKLTDPDRIRAFYKEMSGLILIGQTPQHIEEKHYYVEFVLADNTVCRYDFPEKNYMRIADQIYTIESGSNFFHMIDTLQSD